MSKKAETPSESGQEKPRSPMGPLLWILLPLIAVVIWGLFNR
jgi:hypothetical protein